VHVSTGEGLKVRSMGQEQPTTCDAGLPADADYRASKSAGLVITDMRSSVDSIYGSLAGYSGRHLQPHGMLRPGGTDVCSKQA
jgi:hypothetical protein